MTGRVPRTQVGIFRSARLAWAFPPVPVRDACEASAAPLVLDLTRHPDTVGLDRVDRAAVDLVGNEPHLAGRRRAWRYPGSGSAWARIPPGPRGLRPRRYRE